MRQVFQRRKLRALMDCLRLGLEPRVSKFLARNLTILALDGTDVWGPVRLIKQMSGGRQGENLPTWTNSQSSFPWRRGNSSEALPYTWKAGGENRARWSFQVIKTALKHTNNYCVTPRTETGLWRMGMLFLLNPCRKWVIQEPGWNVNCFLRSRLASLFF